MHLGLVTAGSDFACPRHAKTEQSLDPTTLPETLPGQLALVEQRWVYRDLSRKHLIRLPGMGAHRPPASDSYEAWQLGVQPHSEDVPGSLPKRVARPVGALGVVRVDLDGSLVSDGTVSNVDHAVPGAAIALTVGGTSCTCGCG